MKDLVKYKVIDFCYVTDFVANGSFASLRENVSYINSPDYAVLVRLTDFTKKWSKDFVYVSKASYDFLKKSSLNKGDLIMSNVGEPGIVFLVPDLNQPMTLGPNSILIRPNKNTSTSKFLYFYFLSEIGKKQIDDISTGAAQKKFNKTSFRDIEITLPPLSEQQRIITILDEAFAAIAKAKVNAEQNFKNAKELFESLLIKIFTEGINIKKWKLEKLENYNKVVVGYVGPISKEYTNDENGILLLSTKNIGNKGVSLEKLTRINHQFHEKNKKSQLISGDILVARHGNSGQSAVIPNNIKAAHALNVIIIKKSETLSSEYICFLLNSGVLDKIASSKAGSVQEIINTSIIKDLIIPVPSFEEQQNIVQKLDVLSTETKKLEAIYQQKINDLEELKKSVLQKAFSGELKTDKLCV